MLLTKVHAGGPRDNLLALCTDNYRRCASNGDLIAAPLTRSAQCRDFGHLLAPDAVEGLQRSMLGQPAGVPFGKLYDRRVVLARARGHLDGNRHQPPVRVPCKRRVPCVYALAPRNARTLRGVYPTGRNHGHLSGGYTPRGTTLVSALARVFYYFSLQLMRCMRAARAYSLTFSGRTTDESWRTCTLLHVSLL